MSLNSREHRSSLLQLPTYLANAGFLSTAGWKQAASGHVVVDKANSEVKAMIIVGRVLDSLLNVGPLGNFTAKYPLANAKFQFTLCPPEDTVFAGDWEKAYKAIQTLQNMVADTKYHRNFLTFDNKLANLRFTAPVFESLSDADADDVEAAGENDAWEKLRTS
jgi:hypothetical protein